MDAQEALFTESHQHVENISLECARLRAFIAFENAIQQERTQNAASMPLFFINFAQNLNKSSQQAIDRAQNILRYLAYLQEQWQHSKLQHGTKLLERMAPSHPLLARMDTDLFRVIAGDPST
jgi:conjugal transfer/entry exclusion protein